jgi:plasmid stabilization system protein ParE
VNVELSEEAEAHVLEIDAWWRDNRQAEDLFTDELEETLAMLGETPTLGTKYECRRPGVHRLLLQRTHYHLYFVREPDRIYILAVWSAFRGRGPRL